MDCRSLCRQSLAALLVCLGSSVATASGIGENGASQRIPGDAEVLLNPEQDLLVKVLVNKPDANGVSWPDHVAQPAGRVSGWNIKDVRFRYLDNEDTLIVGVNSFGIIGDADGDGVAGRAAPDTIASGGVEYPRLGGRQSVTVAFDTNLDGVPDVVAGVPAQLPDPLDPNSKMNVPGAGLNGFLVSKYRGGPIQYGYGENLVDNQGVLVADSSAEDPDFLFTVRNFSTLPDLQSPYRFGVRVYAGSPDDVVSGEDSFVARDVRLPQGERIPEPATILAWSLVSLIAVWRGRRLRRPADR
jgi:hypothetical protein